MNKNTLIEYINQELSTHKIAEKSGMGQATIRYWLKKYQLKTNHSCRKNGVSSKKSTRTCASCQREFPNTKEFFYSNGGGLHQSCKACYNKKVVDRQREIKKELVDYKGGKCQACNYNKCIGAMEFHHTDPSIKEFSISSSRNSRIENLKKEVDKCILLCANCHREAHEKSTLF